MHLKYLSQELVVGWQTQVILGITTVSKEGHLRNNAWNTSKRTSILRNTREILVQASRTHERCTNKGNLRLNDVSTTTRYPAVNKEQKVIEAHKSILGDIDELVVGTHDLGNLHRTM